MHVMETIGKQDNRKLDRTYGDRRQDSFVMRLLAFQETGEHPKLHLDRLLTSMYRHILGVDSGHRGQLDLVNFGLDHRITMSFANLAWGGRLIVGEAELFRGQS